MMIKRAKRYLGVGTAILLCYAMMTWADMPPRPYYPPGYVPPGGVVPGATEAPGSSIVLGVDTKTKQRINKFFGKALYKNFKQHTPQPFFTITKDNA